MSTRNEVGSMEMWERTLVSSALGIVLLLRGLVGDGVLAGSQAGSEAGIRVLGDALVGLLGCLGTSALDGLGDVVGGVLR